MNGMKLFGTEIQHIIKDKKVLIPLIAILFIPLIYSGMFLWSFKDPYGQMDELPVAVVNNDEGATMDSESLQLGEDLVKNLKESGSFDFHFVSEEEAMDGLDNLTYYMVIRIPSDFSENATTLLDDSPQKLELDYIPNDSYNFLASQIGETAVAKIQTSVASEVSKTYAETMFSKAEEMADGFQTASDGSEQVNDGATQLQDGASQLKESLELLASKSIEFQNGLDEATSGTNDVADGANELSDGIGQLDDAGEKLLSASQSVQSGAQTVSSGISTVNAGLLELSGNLPRLVSGTNQVLAGLTQFQTQLPSQLASQIAGNSAGLNSYLDQLNSSIDSGLTDTLAPQLTAGLSQGAAEKIAESVIASQQEQMQQLASILTPQLGEEQTQAIINAMAASAPTQAELQQNLQSTLQSEFETGINNSIHSTTTSIDAGFDQLAQGISQQLSASTIESQIATATDPVFDKLISGVQEVSEGQQAVETGVDKLADGTQQLDAGASKLSDGQNEYVANFQTFTEKFGEARTGIEQLTQGTRVLYSGMTQLVDGSLQLGEGTSQLATGAGDLYDGTSELQSGTDELYTKLSDAADQASSLDGSDDTYDMMASPVELNTEHVNTVPNYGTGFAPYFMSLGLFVGALIITIIFPVVDSAGTPRNGLSWFISKFGVMAIVGVIQAILTGLVVLYGLDIEVQNVPLFFLYSIITSLTFITLIQFLVSVGNNPGRFIAILILILQLTSSAGTFPLEVIPKAVQWFNPILPMTYSVRGLKAVISSGDYSYMWQNAGILFIYIAGAVLLTMGYFTYKFKKQYSNTTFIQEDIAV